jgi:hypothetical protein
MKYQNNLMKGFQDIERTSSGLLTDRQVQSNMPLFFEGGHKNVGHHPFRKVIRQNIEFLINFLVNKIGLFRIWCSICENISTRLIE